jgi:hypothetical protein
MLGATSPNRMHLEHAFGWSSCRRAHVIHCRARRRIPSGATGLVQEAVHGTTRASICELGRRAVLTRSAHDTYHGVT